LEISVEALESLLSRGRRALRAALADVAQDLMGGMGDGA
jgi:DNA-directed RNA polymerase specialized sigma24 family protein